MGRTAGETIVQIDTDVHTNVHMDKNTNRLSQDSRKGEGGDGGSSTKGAHSLR